MYSWTISFNHRKKLGEGVCTRLLGTHTDLCTSLQHQLGNRISVPTFRYTKVSVRVYMCGGKMRQILTYHTLTCMYMYTAGMEKERLELEPGYAAHLYGSYMYSVLVHVLVMLSFQTQKSLP